MRRLQIIPALALLGLLAGCGTPDPAASIASSPTERPTAYTLPTASPTTAPAAPTEPARAPAPPTEAAIDPVAPPRQATDPPLPPAAQAPTATVAPSAPAAPTTLPATATSEPTPQPTAAPTEAAPPPTPTQELEASEQEPPAQPAHVIVIDTPQAGMAVSSPMELRGSANFWPFEANLSGVLRDASGNVLAHFPVTVNAPDMGQGGPFSEQVTFTPPVTEQEGTLEVMDVSAKDGSILTQASVKVRLVPAPAPGTALQFEYPEEGGLVASPLHVAFGGARGDERLVLRLVQADGGVLTHDTRADLGYVVTTIPGKVVPGPATLEVARADGTMLARRTMRIAAPPETQVVKVAWGVPNSEEIVMAERRVPRTPQIATAALNELLWGPAPGETNFATSLPAPGEVLSYSGRAAGWGPRVRLLKLTITDGVALANFSPELRAYGGGSARVGMIRKQIEATLRQFPSVQQVVIAIDGQTEGVLEP